MSFKAGAIIGEAILDTKKWNTGVTSMQSSFKSISRAGKAMGLAVAGYLTASTLAANAFQIKMKNVSTIMDDTTDSTQELTLQLLNLNPRLGKTTELTNSLYLAYSAGAESMAEAMQVTVDSAKLGAAILTDSTTALDILTSATNAYGKEVITTTQASDIFFKTVEEGKITGEQLSATIGQSIPLYASAGVGLDQLGAGIAAMTKQGVSASEATTQLNAIINTMLRPTQAMKEALEEMGYASGGAMLETEGLTGVLKLVEANSNGSSDAMAKLTPNLRAVKGFMALTSVGGEIYTDVLEKMGRAAGSTDEAFMKQERTFITLLAELDKISIVVGNISKFFVDELAESLTVSATAILDFIMSAEGMELVGNIAGYTAGTFNLLKTVFTSFNDMIDKATIAEKLEDIGIGAGNSIGKVALLSDAMELIALTINMVSFAALDSIKLIQLYGTQSSAFFDFMGASFNRMKAVFADKEVKAELDKALLDARNAIEKASGDFEALSSTQGERMAAYLKATFIDLASGSDQLSKDITLSFTSSFEGMKDSVLANWIEMITGMKKEAAVAQKEGQEYLKYSLQWNKQAFVNEASLMDKLKKAWDKYFAEGELTFKRGYEAFMSAASAALSGLSDISAQYYSNQFDRLEIETQKELDLYEELNLSKITDLREAEAITSSIKDDYRQDEIDSLTETLAEMSDISAEYRQSELDAFKEQTDQEIALDKYKRDEYIAKLSDSIELADQLELAAFLSRERRDAEELVVKQEVLDQREIMEQAFADAETTRLNELAQLEIDIAKEKKDAEDQALIEETKRLEDLALAEKAYQDGIDKINQDALDDQNRIAKEQFEINQALSIAAVWMNAASAIAGFWTAAALLGPVAGPIFGGVMSTAMMAMGFTQTALINDQEFIPAREMGGMASGLTRINEAGGEIVTLPDGSQVIPNDISTQIASNAGNIATKGDTIINFYDTQISKDIDIDEMVSEISYRLGRELGRAV